MIKETTSSELIKVRKIKKPSRKKSVGNFKLSDLHSKDTSKGMKILERCRNYYDGLENMRKIRRYHRSFLNGNQWEKKELEAIRKNGGVAITQNICSLLERNLLGQYWSNKTFPVAVARKAEAASEGAIMSLAIENAISINKDDVNDADMLQEVTLSGIACSRVSFSWNAELNRNEINTRNTPINRLFFNTDIVDNNNFDSLHTIGEICDDTIEGILCKFAKTDEDKEFLEKVFAGYGKKENQVNNDFSTSKEDNIMFGTSGSDYCRYYEVWSKEIRKVVKYHDYAYGTYGATTYSTKEIEEINRQRIALAMQQGMSEEELQNIGLIDYNEGFEEIWMVRYITDNGYILKEMETPYEHGQHPYVLLLHNFIDGNVHPILSDIIDQQKYINRLVQMMDFAMGRAAKGVLIVPKDCIPEGCNLDDIAESWSDFNGVIELNLKPGIPAPQQITANVMNFGAREMFDVQLSLMQQIFGVNQAIQGQKADAGTPASRYAQETQNATLNSRDLFERFGVYKSWKYTKVMKTIKQYYDEPLYIQVAGKNYDQNEGLYEPAKLKPIEFDLKISQSANSSAYQSMIDDTLFQLLQQGMIDVKMYLSRSNAAWASGLLSDITKKEEDLKNEANLMAQQQQGLPMAAEQAPQQQAPQQAPANNGATKPSIRESLMNVMSKYDQANAA